MENKPVLKIKSTGPINEANIEINKINIVGGVNGSGKTTVAKLLYCFFKVASDKKNYHLYKLFVDKVNNFNEYFNSFGIDNVNQNFSYDSKYETVLNEFKYAKGLFFSHKLYNELFPQELSYEEGYELFFGEIYALIDILEGKIDYPNFEVLLDLMNKESVLNLLNDNFSFKMGSFEFKSSDQLQSQLDYEGSIPDVFYIDTSSVFDLNEPFHIPEHTLYLRGILDEEPEWWKEIYNYVPKSFLERIELDDSILQDNDDRLPDDFKKKLNSLLNNPKHNLPDENKEILSKVENLVNGRYLTRTESFCFTKEVDSKIISSDLSNIPSGIKQIGSIQLLLSKGKLKNGSYLIIDEPEVNLHPDWQFKFAEILVLLAKDLDITLYINSHSPIFIESMDAFIEFYDMESEANYYLIEESGIYDKYNFTKINSNDLYKIYDNLGNAYDLIDQLRLKKHLGE